MGGARTTDIPPGIIPDPNGQLGKNHRPLQASWISPSHEIIRTDPWILTYSDVIAIVTGSVFGSLLAICGPLCLICLLWKRKKDKQKKVGPVNEPQTGPPTSIPNNEYTGVSAIRYFCVAACSPVCLILKRLKDKCNKKKQTEPAADPVTSHGSITDNSLVEKDVEVVDETQDT